MLILVLLHFVLLSKIHVFCIEKEKISVDEEFQSISLTKLRMSK